LGSDSGNRLHQDSSAAGDFQFLALNISLLIERRASVWRTPMTYVLELPKRLNYLAVCHVHQDILDASNLDEVIELFINLYESRIKLLANDPNSLIRLRLLIDSNTIAAHVFKNNLN